jgi:2,3-diaminopropionate biosynthesis protein SbnA
VSRRRCSVQASSYDVRIGKTPLVPLDLGLPSTARVFAKLEGANPTGSIKDRGAQYGIVKLLRTNQIDRNTTIIESSSGNFGIALAAVCRQMGLRFVCVVDPHITRTNEMLMRFFGAELIKVDNADAHGGYLLTRIRTVKEFLAANPNSYWMNQYANPLIAEAYAETIGEELWSEVPRLDLLFVGVSSGGTIAGLTRKNLEKGGRTTIVPVDSEGSIIFGGKPMRRYIPGIGSSMVPGHFATTPVSKPIMVAERDAVTSCRELLARHCLFVGGSSGSVFQAVREYFTRRDLERHVTAVAIFADQGDRYADTIFNDEWVNRVFGTPSAAA